MLQPESEVVEAAACGGAHSVVLLSCGGVLTAGANHTGQCGQDLDLQEVRGNRWSSICSCGRSSCTGLAGSHRLESCGLLLNSAMHVSVQQAVGCEWLVAEQPGHELWPAYTLCFDGVTTS